MEKDERDQRRREKPGLQRFKLASQVNRAVFYTFACVVGILLQVLGAIHLSYLFFLSLWALAVLSALVLYFVYSRWWRLNLDPIWFIFDSAMVTWVVFWSGGSHSPWFPWYVASIGAAAVGGGVKWALAMAVVDCASYLGLLVATGEVAFASGAFVHELSLMISLFCAPAFLLLGTVALQKKRLKIKQLEENERRKVAELTQVTEALNRRTQELAEANVKVSGADKLKSQFLANMSHELRTPLNSIIGFSEIMLTREDAQIAERDLRFLKNIHTSGQHLLGLINDILDLSKIEAGRAEVFPEQFPIEYVLDGVCTIMRGVADRRGVVLQLDLPPDLPQLEADVVKVKQIFYNLLSNAVKFSPDKASVIVAARSLDANASALGVPSIRVAVRDHGQGIDPKYHEAIFDAFRQLDSAAGRSFGGTGLGLALVKRFVELHGGHITVESSPGHGTSFAVLLPLRFMGVSSGPPSPTVVSGTLSEPPAVASEGAFTVLVVEDDPTAYEAIARELVRVRLAPVRARSGEEAIRLARELSPAAITLDIILPGMDGWETLKRLKEDPVARGIPVIIISLLDNRELGMALGADDYFLKPIDGGAFLQRIQELIPSSAPHEARLLLIDDDPKMHDLLENVLLPAGYVLEHASSGQEGLDKAAAGEYNLVILDLLMEGMDGFEVAAALRAQPATAALPILVLTAKEMTIEEHGKLLGKVNALLQKGTASMVSLVTAIRDLVARRQKRS